jgi:6-phosphofructokinase
MARAKRVGILTGGGDVPGLNPAIKAVVETAIDKGWEAVGIRRGWGGLLHCNLDSPQAGKHLFVPLTRSTVRTIDRTGGTFLHTSRTNPQRVKAADVPDFLQGNTEAIAGEGVDAVYDFTPHILNVLEFLAVDALIPIGGDDTLSFAARMHQEGFPLVAIPKTMDNDVYGTDYCIGFSTAVTRSVEFIGALRTPSGSHERISIVELFGRNSGETSLIAAYLADVDRAIISEVPFEIQRLALLLVQDKYNNPSNYAIMTISEGAREIGGDLVHYAAIRSWEASASSRGKG